MQPRSRLRKARLNVASRFVANDPLEPGPEFAATASMRPLTQCALSSANVLWVDADHDLDPPVRADTHPRRGITRRLTRMQKYNQQKPYHTRKQPPLVFSHLPVWRPLDIFGHGAACSRAGILGTRVFALESAAPGVSGRWRSRGHKLVLEGS